MYSKPILFGAALVAALGAGCASSGKDRGETREIVYVRSGYFHVPAGYAASCRSGQLLVRAPDGGQLTGSAALDSVAPEGATAISDDAGLNGQPILAASGTRCQYGYARGYREPPRIDVRINTGVPDTRIGVGTDIGVGGGSVGGRVGGTVGGATGRLP